MTFAQLSARLKNFLRGWLLVLGLKEGLVECATVCIKSVVILVSVVRASERSVLTNETSNLSLQVTLSHIFLGGDIMGLQEVLKDFLTFPACFYIPIIFFQFEF